MTEADAAACGIDDEHQQQQNPILFYRHYTALRKHESPAVYTDHIEHIDNCAIDEVSALKWIEWVINVASHTLHTELQPTASMGDTMHEIKDALTNITLTDNVGRDLVAKITPALNAMLDHASVTDYMAKFREAKVCRVQLYIDSCSVEERLSRLNRYLMHYVCYDDAIVPYMPDTLIGHSIFSVLLFLLALVTQVDSTRVAAKSHELFYHLAYSMLVDFMTDRHYREMYATDRNELTVNIRRQLLEENPMLKHVRCEADLSKLTLTPLLREHAPNALALYMDDRTRCRYIYAQYHTLFTQHNQSVKFIPPERLWDEILVPTTRALCQSKCPGRYDISINGDIIPSLVSCTNSADPKELYNELGKVFKNVNTN